MDEIKRLHAKAPWLSSSIKEQSDVFYAKVVEIVQSVERQGCNEQRDEGCALWVNRPSNGQIPSNSRSYAYDPVLEASLYNASAQNSPVRNDVPAAAYDGVDGPEDLASSSSEGAQYTTGSAEKTGIELRRSARKAMKMVPSAVGVVKQEDKEETLIKQEIVDK